MARRSMIPFKKPTSWLQILMWVVGGSILIKAFWPKGDQQLSELSAKVKKTVDGVGQSTTTTTKV